ncbi:methionyl-tRNA formyltransferase-like protein [Halomarina oriensis]|uniref:Methionyl-tRNA formyltransferase-like protein n=2 Tax=Halomarina oriensis TaxID=671145 RepID=A0A6B0GM21_9EURY|nr:formyltransferase family protein [Halomarina oriensis]MWG33185.1 methionyl-tRNA formyltransferase-like protein [Halomarina oriensis]
MRRWAAAAVARAIDDGVLSVERVVINDDVAASLDDDGVATLRRYVDTARDYGVWTPVSAYRSVVAPPAHLEWVDLDDLPWADVPRVLCTPQPAETFGQVLPTEVVDTVAAETDVVVRFGFGIVKGDILTEPDHGVLSFHHGDVRRYRGRPVGVWEYIDGAHEGGVTLQRLTETLDGGAVVAFESVNLSDAETWPDVERRLYAASEGMLSTGLASLRAGESPERIDSDDLGPLYTTPGARETVRFLVKNTVGMARRVLAR